MALFETYRLSREQAERRLKRTLSGDPASGEQSVLVALNCGRLKVAQEMLEGDPMLGEDFRKMVRDHLRSAGGRAATIKHWSVPIRLPVWDEYAAEARRSGMRIGEVLSAALENELARRGQALDPIERLDANVRAYHSAAGTLIARLEAVVGRMGAGVTSPGESVSTRAAPRR